MIKFGICLSFLFQFTLILAFKKYSYSSSQRPACPFGPCEVPQCCDTGIAIKMGQSPFTKNKCYHRGCYSCLSQQYLLGIHERCSLDQSVMKSLCSPGMSCMIYCSERVYGKEHCWHKYGTCQHDHVPRLAESKYPGNITVIPGLKKSDAKRHALCTRDHTMCKCRNRKCDSGNRGEKSWCFISYIHNPAHPTQNCYADVRWSATYGSFYSHEACQKLEGKDTYNSRYKVSSLAHSEPRSASDDKKAPAMDNFDKIAEKEVESEKIPTPPSAPEPEPDSVPEPSDQPQPDAEKIPEEIPDAEKIPEEIPDAEKIPEEIPEPEPVPVPEPEPETEPVPEPEQIPEPEQEPETVPPPKDEPTTAMPAEALDTSTNPPVEQEDANNEDGEEHDFYWNFDENDEVDKTPTAESAKEDPQVEETGGKIDASELLK